MGKSLFILNYWTLSWKKKKFAISKKCSKEKGKSHSVSAMPMALGAVVHSICTSLKRALFAANLQSILTSYLLLPPFYNVCFYFSFWNVLGWMYWLTNLFLGFWGTIPQKTITMGSYRLFSIFVRGQLEKTLWNGGSDVNGHFSTICLAAIKT